ncbi:MAG: MobA/MobL family protein [Geminicoccaceae bacterium]|nr:MobA/MobL family protein [Geminicoccaceae bacterium]
MAVVNETTLHTRIKPMKRSEGRNAVRSAAYRSGSKLTDGRTAETWDYTNRRGVEHAEIITPDEAPAWAMDRHQLWNRAEQAERRKDSQVAREYEFLFSYDLTPEQRIGIAREVAREEFVARGMVADVAIHRYGRAWKLGQEGTGETIAKWRSWGLPFLDEASSARTETQHVMVTSGRGGENKAYYLFQPHCHVQLTMRPIAADGEGFEKKSAGSVARSWNDQKTYDGIRERTAARQNHVLEETASVRRLDHRSYEERRVEAEGLALEARDAGRHEEAAHYEARARYFTRDPQPYLGFALRLKELTGRIRERFSQWVAVKHKNRIRDYVDLMEREEPHAVEERVGAFLARTARSLGLDRLYSALVPEPERPARETGLER